MDHFYMKAFFSKDEPTEIPHRTSELSGAALASFSSLFLVHTLSDAVGCSDKPTVHHLPTNNQQTHESYKLHADEHARAFKR